MLIQIARTDGPAGVTADAAAVVAGTGVIENGASVESMDLCMPSIGRSPIFPYMPLQLSRGAAETGSV